MKTDDVVTTIVEVAVDPATAFAIFTEDIAARKREIKRWGWANILGWFSEWAFWRSPRRIHSAAAVKTGY